MVLEVQVPAAAPGTKSAFIKFAIRKSIDFPVVNCAAAVVSDGGVVKLRAHLPQLRLCACPSG